jgi:membrane-bound inhibitor of C-type lysozyme
MRHLITSLVSLGGLFLAAGAAADNEVHYTCEDKTRLSVSFLGQDAGSGAARLMVAGSPVAITLPQVLAADGGRYAGDGTEFWVKGRSARLSRTGSAVTTCHVN